MHLWLLTLGTAGIGVAAVLGKVVHLILAIRVPKDKITEYAATITPRPGPEPPVSEADPLHSGSTRSRHTRRHNSTGTASHWGTAVTTAALSSLTNSACSSTLSVDTPCVRVGRSAASFAYSAKRPTDSAVVNPIHQSDGRFTTGPQLRIRWRARIGIWVQSPLGQR